MEKSERQGDPTRLLVCSLCGTKEIDTDDRGICLQRADDSLPTVPQNPALSENDVEEENTLPSPPVKKTPKAKNQATKSYSILFFMEAWSVVWPC